MIVRRLLIITLLALAPIGVAGACADPPKASFREIVATAPTIFVFQLTTAAYVRESGGGETFTQYVLGDIRVIESLKGSGESFNTIKYAFRSCGSTRMSVGQFYLAATSQDGPILELWRMDQAILDLTLDFYTEKSKHSHAVNIVRKIVGGSPVPADFPREELVKPLRVYPLPPPPVKRH